MHTVIALYIAATTMLEDARERRSSEDGQTSVEWLGIAFVVVSIIGLLAAQSETISGLISTRFQALVNSATGG